MTTEFGDTGFMKIKIISSYLGKLVEYRKTVRRKGKLYTYKYLDIRIKSQKEFKENFKSGEFVSVTLQKLDVK